jgi:hypothetical protein
MSIKSIKFHIKSNDYFGTLATIISMVKQQPENIKSNQNILNRLEKQLMFLQNNYRIVKK